MSSKAFIASTFKAQTKLLDTICTSFGMEVIYLQDTDNLETEIHDFQPDVLFIQNTLIEENQEKLSQIRDLEALNNMLLVICGYKNGGTTEMEQFISDWYIDMSLAKPQIQAFMRHYFNKPRRLLFIKDSKLNRFSGIIAHLTGEKFEVIELSPDSENSMEMVEEYFPDIILIDENLKSTSGIDFIRQIKENHYLVKLPMIAFTDRRSAEKAEELFSYGVSDILYPPYDSRENMGMILSLSHPIPLGKKYKALVVDDSSIIRNLISKMFKQLGFKVSSAVNGLEGLTAALRENPDIITSDYDMPVMNGWEFCSELKKFPAMKDVPVVMVTTRNTKVDMQKGRALGVYDYLPKPFEIEDLQKIVNTILREKKEKERRLLLSKYVAADAITNTYNVMKGISEAESESKFISILFSDIVGFSTKCEKHDAKWIVNMLNNFFDAMIDALLEHSAIIDKMIGDAIVARFATGNKETDAYNAVKGALGMLKALEKFNEGFGFDEPVKVRIGVNSGEVVLGNIGSKKHRLDYTMIGDNVNIAQRLESNAPHNGCLISDFTYQIISNKIIVGERKEIMVKGRKEPVPVYIVQGLKS